MVLKTKPVLVSFLIICVTVANQIFGFKSIAAYRSGLEINTNVTRKDAEEGLSEILSGECSMWIGVSQHTPHDILTNLSFQLESLPALGIKALSTMSSLVLWRLLYALTCRCRYTQGNTVLKLIFGLTLCSKMMSEKT